MQWMMLQQKEAKDYVIATGVQYTVHSLIDKAAHELGITLEFVGEGIAEKGIMRRVTGDASLAKSGLGWIPEIALDELVRSMVAGDLANARQSALLKQHVHHIPVGKED